MKSLLPLIFSKFILVGGLCYIINISALYIFTNHLKIHYLGSSLLGFLLANSVGYIANRTYTFPERKIGFWRGLWKYNAVMLSSCLIVLLLMIIFVEVFKIGYLSANISIAVGSTIYNFIFHHKWTFREEQR